MDLHYTYTPEGVCASEICFDIVDGILHNIKFTGGCRGNTQGVALLVTILLGAALLAEGMRAEDVVKRLKGVDCHGGFSCPDQLAKAVTQCLAESRSQGGRSLG